MRTQKINLWISLGNEKSTQSTNKSKNFKTFFSFKRLRRDFEFKSFGILFDKNFRQNKCSTKQKSIFG